jgi:hypothetical protein
MSEFVDRAEHLAWCKRRALEYLDDGDVVNAIASMSSDLGKHPGTETAAGLLMIGMTHAAARDVAGARRWIEGFR